MIPERNPSALKKGMAEEFTGKKGLYGNMQFFFRIFFIFMLKNRSNHVKVFVVKKTNVFERKTDDDDRRNLCIHWMK